MADGICTQCTDAVSHVASMPTMPTVQPCMCLSYLYPWQHDACASVQALAALCEGTEQDMRACINTLQFLARRCDRVRVADVEGAAIGHKDVTRSAFTLWQQLLSAKVTRNLHAHGEAASPSKAVSDVLAGHTPSMSTVWLA